VDRERVALHLARQAERGGRHLGDLRQPHWERRTSPPPEIQSAAVDVPPGARPKKASAVAANGSAQAMPTASWPTGGRPPAERASSHQAPRQPTHPPATDLPGARAAPLRPLRYSRLPEQPASAAPGYRELVQLEGAHRVRSIALPGAPRPLKPEPLDLEILALIACMGHLLSSQIHTCFNPGRSVTTTQRRLKRLSDAGLVRRFQFHRRDGGGAPMCYALAPAGVTLLAAGSGVGARTSIGARTGVSADLSVGARTSTSDQGPSTALQAGPVAASHRSGSDLTGRGALASEPLGHARRDVRMAGWALALQRACPDTKIRIRGTADSVLSPPPRGGAETGVPLGPDALRLPGGRVAHEFLRGLPTGERVAAERFETIRPHLTIEATLEASGRAPGSRRPHGDPRAVSHGLVLDLLVELDRSAADRCARTLERYDHLLAGWSAHTTRYGDRSPVVPVLVLVCRDRARARERARLADAILTACRAYPGEYPAEWQYLGREAVLCVAERDVHEGSLCGYGVPRLPPAVRASSLSAGDPGSRAAAIEPLELSCARVEDPA
jgi:hypothetical protein